MMQIVHWRHAQPPLDVVEIDVGRRLPKRSVIALQALHGVIH